jgi:hypothetical protein
MIDLYYPAVIGWGLLAIINLIDCIKDDGSITMCTISIMIFIILIVTR